MAFLSYYAPIFAEEAAFPLFDLFDCGGALAPPYFPGPEQRSLEALVAPRPPPLFSPVVPASAAVGPLFSRPRSSVAVALTQTIILLNITQTGQPFRALKIVFVVAERHMRMMKQSQRVIYTIQLGASFRGAKK